MSGAEARELTVRDRPWAFWGGWVMAFFGVAILGMGLFMPERGPRDAEVNTVARWVGWLMLGIGAIGIYRGRAARFEPSTRQLIRGGDVVYDLSNACGLAVYRPIERSPAHYIMVLLGPPDPTRLQATTFEELRREGDDALNLAEGVPPGMAKYLVQRWHQALQVPVVLLPNVQFTLT